MLDTRSVVRALSALLLLPAPAWAATYYVANGGDDAAAGDANAPWETLQHAADAVAAGDTVIVRAGGYAGFYQEQSGANGRPITFRAEGNVRITEENSETPDGINLEGASHIVVEGFTVNGMQRAGLRAVTAERVTLRNNQADANGRWGILTGFVDDLLIENNRTSGSIAEHGIYVSNSGDRPVIRNNVIWNNAANGIHMNSDAEQGGDGVISSAIVEGNVIYSNGAQGGSGINCDGVQDSLLVNNLIYDAHASGISLYRIDGRAPSTGNEVINNTVVVASDGRWALNIQDDSSGTTVYNNIFLNLHASRGAIALCGPGCEAELTSDHNIVVNRFTRNDSDVLTLASWRTATGQDASSAVSDSAALFVDAPGGDYHLTEGSPAIDHGTSTQAPDHDLDGNQRPAGDAVDMGAYEVCEDDCVPSSGGASGGRGGNSSAGGADDEPGGTSSTPGGRSPGGSSGTASTNGGSSSSGTGTGGRAGGAPASGGTSSDRGGAATAGNATAGSGAPSGTAGSDDDGCSCKIAGGRTGTSSHGALLAAGALLMFGVRRSRRSASGRPGDELTTL